MYPALIRRSLVVAASFAIAGCGGAQSVGTPAASSAWARFVHAGVPVASFGISHPTVVRRSVRSTYSTKGSLIFEGDQSEVQTNVYSEADVAAGKNPGAIASISAHAGCPYGIATDKKGTLYVADNCGGNDVEEFPKGSTTLKTALTSGVENPLGIAVDKKGTIYVTSYVSGTGGEILEFKPGKSTPFQTISGQGLADPFGLALDKKQNLYIADFGAAAVFEIKYGTTSVINLGLSGCGEPLGVADNQKNGDLWVACGSGNTIEVYHAGDTSPFESIPGNDYPYAITLENQGKPKDVVVESDIDTHDVYLYPPNKYSSSATLTNGVSLPTGLLVAKP